ncbi:hypothetical protein DIPPA_06931 [Diplonema papillatum]|nr:hypothetical protein DIPPA_06931 [Diplonema papillatum]
MAPTSNVESVQRSSLTDLCSSLMVELKAHKEQTGTDPWESLGNKKVAVDLDALKLESEALGNQSMDEVLDAFDDMIDDLTQGQKPLPAAPAQRAAENIEEGLEDLVRLAAKQMKEHGLPNSLVKAPDANAMSSLVPPGAKVVDISLDDDDDLSGALDSLVEQMQNQP